MEIKLNNGAIFKNDFKKEGDKQPEYRGKINVDGTIKEISLWAWKSKEGKMYFSVGIQDEYKPETAQPSMDEIPPEDDLPF